MKPLAVCSSTWWSKSLFSLVLLLCCTEYKISLLRVKCKSMQNPPTLEFFGVFPLTLELFPCVLWDKLCHVPFKVWQMPSASARATSQVALASSLHPRGWACSSTFWAWFAPFGSWPPTVHWSWSNPASFNTGCKAMYLWGLCVVPAWCTPCLPEKDTPALVACWNTSVFLFLFLTQEPLALVPQIILLPLLFILFPSAAVSFGFSQMLEPSTILAATSYQFMCLFHQSCDFILSPALYPKAALDLFLHVCKTAVP